MINKRQAYEAALILRKWCRQHGKDGCDTCMFRSGRHNARNDITGCRVGNGDIPEFWNLGGVSERAKK